MASAPKLWNRLPSNIRAVNDLNCFRTLSLKTHHFRQAFSCLLLQFVFIFFSQSNCIFLAFYSSFSHFILLNLIVQRIRSYPHVFCDISIINYCYQKGQWQKSSNFGLCGCTKLKYFTFLYLVLGKSIHLVKIAFSVTLWHVWRHDSSNTDLMVKKGIFWRKLGTCTERVINQ